MQSLSPPFADLPLPPDAAPPLDPPESARAAGLRYVNHSMPGIQRVKSGKGFRYLDPSGAVIRDPETLGRIRSLAIPPAWRDVWICPLANGHLQAVGRDARNRKQYCYHPRWREVRDEVKYGQMIAFGLSLPAIRRHVDEDMSLQGLPRRKILATLVRLLETTLIRVGNEEYARENESYGLTTFRTHHVEVSSTTVKFRFRGKSGVNHSVKLTDRRVARILKRVVDLPGEELFQYVDESGELRTVQSTDVNDYLKEITGQDFTAKDFRTWAGTVLAARALQEFPSFSSKTEAKRNITKAVEAVAGLLGNTKAVCRKCYVHPDIFDTYMEGQLVEALSSTSAKDLAEDLRPEEAATLRLLQQRLVRAAEVAAQNVRMKQKARRTRRAADLVSRKRTPSAAAE